MPLVWRDKVAQRGILAFVLLAAYFSAWLALYNEGKPRNLFYIYHNEFAPAVMMACGRGFTNVDFNSIPSLNAFLKISPLSRTPTFDCNQLPETIPVIPLDGYQKTYAYLLGLPGLIWQWSGVISWSFLSPFLAIFHAITAAALYGIFRLGMGGAVAAFLTLVLTCSGELLYFVKDFREYNKTTFIYILVFLLGWLVKHGATPASWYRVAVLAGVTLGIGVGFRVDVLIMLPPLLIALFLFTPLNLRVHFKERIFAVCLLLMTMIGSGWSIFPALSGGGNPNLNFIMGFANNFSSALGIMHSLYEIEPLYHDQYLYLQMNDYAQRVLSTPLPIVDFKMAGDYFTEAYGQVGSLLFQDILITWPADFLVRFLAAVRQILNMVLPYDMGLLLAGVVILRLALYQLRLAIFLLLLIFWLAGYPSLLFKERHFLHLIFLPCWIAGVVISPFITKITAWGWRRVSQSPSLPNWLFSPNPLPPVLQYSREMLQRAVLLLSPLFLLLFLLMVARFVQSSTMSKIIADMESLPYQPLKWQSIPLSQNKVRLSSPLLSQEREKRVGQGIFSSLLMLEFANAACAQPDGLPIALRFINFQKGLDQSREAMLYIPEGGMKIIYPLLLTPETHFAGLELPKDKEYCLTSLSWTQQLQGLRLLPVLTLPKHWQAYPLYQTLAVTGRLQDYSLFLTKNRTFDFQVAGKGM